MECPICGVNVPKHNIEEHTERHFSDSQVASNRITQMSPPQSSPKLVPRTRPSTFWTCSHCTYAENDCDAANCSICLANRVEVSNPLDSDFVNDVSKANSIFEKMKKNMNPSPPQTLTFTMYQQSSKVPSFSFGSPSDESDIFLQSIGGMKEGTGGTLKLPEASVAEGESKEVIFRLRTNMGMLPPQPQNSAFSPKGNGNGNGNGNYNYNNDNDNDNDNSDPPKTILQAYVSKLITPTTSLSITQLKSILQKNVRRRRQLPAVRTALAIIYRDPKEFFRRMSIIIVEDSTWFSGGMTMVWLMVAFAKGWSVPNLQCAEKIVNVCIDVVWRTAGCKFIDNAIDDITQVVQDCASDSVKLNVLMPTNILTKSLLLRMHYGGMKGDMSMLESAAFKFYSRESEKSLSFARAMKVIFPPQELANTTAISTDDHHEFLSLQLWPALQNWTQLVEFVNYQKIPNSPPRIDNQPPNFFHLTSNDALKEGIDFHCSEIINESLTDELRRQIRSVDGVGDSVDSLDGLLREVMWSKRSSTNHKVSLQSESSEKNKDEDDDNVDSLAREQKRLQYTAIYEIMKRAWDTYSSEYIRRRL